MKNICETTKILGEMGISESFAEIIYGIAASSGIFLILMTLYHLTSLYLKPLLGRRYPRSLIRIQDSFLKDLCGPIRLFIAIVCVVIGFRFVELDSGQAKTIAQDIRLVLLFAVAWTLSRIIDYLLHTNRIVTGISENGRTLIGAIARVLTFAIMTLSFLDTLGVSITPFLASLGIGSLAVALALQDTLSNVFSGMYILLDHPFGLGDYIRLDPSTEGNIVRVSWRSTHIRMPSNNILVIPNSKLATSQFINFDLADSQCMVKVPIGVSNNSDLEHVEEVTLKIAKNLLETHPAGVTSFTPYLRFGHFAEFSVHFEVFLRAKSVNETQSLQHEFIKTVHKIYREEQIERVSPRN